MRPACTAARTCSGGWTPLAFTTSATTRSTTSPGRAGCRHCSRRHPDRSTLDLNALTDIGVRLAGRLAGITEDGKAQFAGSLRNMCAMSDLKMGRLLDLIDAWARDNGLDGRSRRLTARRPRGSRRRRRSA